MKTQSLQDKVDLVFRGKFGKINSLKRNTLPFENLSLDQLKDELDSRGIYTGNLKMTKKDLGFKLKAALKGVKRLPVLLLNSPQASLNDIQLNKYEICMVECMHDIANHIDNIITELPNHVKLNDKIEIKKYLDIYQAEKERKRCCDKRRILLILTKYTYHKIDGKVHKLLRTLCEIQRILYLGEEYRTPKEILRLHKVCFEHFILFKSVLNILFFLKRYLMWII